MNYDRGLGFIGGFVLGSLVGAVFALLLAPASGAETRDEIRAEGLALKQRGQEFGDDTRRQAQKIVKQGQRNVSDAQTHVGRVIEDQKDNLREAVGAGK